LFEIAHEDAIRSASQQPRKIGLAHREWQIPQIVTVHRQYVKGTELHLFVVPAGMQGIEIGITVNAQDDCLAIDDELLLPVLQGSFNDPGKALCPIVSASGNQPHPIAVALNTQAVAVVFDFVEPVGAGRDADRSSREAKVKRFKHERKIGFARWNCESRREGGPGLPCTGTASCLPGKGEPRDGLCVVGQYCGTP
jgi:hypothetical protein